MGWLADWWRRRRSERDYCAICREYLPPHGGGIQSWGLRRVCSTACAEELESLTAW